MPKILNLDTVVDKLKSLLPSELVQAKLISYAPNYNSRNETGYICPLCGSGEHGGGTGAGSFDAQGRFYCHACGNADVGGHKLSQLDLFAYVRGLQNESFIEQVTAMANEFGVAIEYGEEGENHSSRRRRTFNIDATPKKEKPSVDARELELIQKDIYETSDEDLKAFVIIACKGAWRGFDADFLIKHGVKYIFRWTPPKKRVAGEYVTPTQRIIIPSGSDFYVARFCGNLENCREETRKYIEQTLKLNAGSPKLFRSRPNVLELDEPVICVEGAIDALSIEYSGYPAVALNGRGNGKLLVDALKRRIAEKKKLPRVIIMMDSDAQGRKAAPTVYQMLIDIGVTCCVRFLFDEETKKDFNDILVEEGKENLRGILQNIVDDSLSELDATAQVLAEKEENSTDENVAAGDEENLIDALFRGDASDDDFADRMKLFCGGEIHWQKDIKSWLIFERNQNGGAVWTDAGEQNSCLLPFARKMTDAMIEHAKNYEQRELAKKFKSTKKRLQSITALKGIDDILITSDDLNQHAEFLNVRNGVIDLTSGKLLQASPELLLSQQAAAVFNPKCDDKTFANFLKSVLPDEETRAVILRFLGYCLTADVSAEKYLLIYGRGGNGKGVLLLTLRTLLKDFAVELPVDTVLENRGRLTADANGRATTEISPLAMRRLGIVDELPRNGRMDVAKVNRLTGGDFIPMRLLHREYKDVAPTHKIIMTGNYRPRIDDTRDAALLRRLLVVNFTQDFTENPDVTLKKKLVADAALTGALNLLVPAAVEFFKHGLIEPSAAMNHAREDFLGENDFVGEYLSEYYDFDENLSTKRKDLLKHMREKCDECARYTDADLTTMISKVDGVTYNKDRHNANVFKGIGLVPPKKEKKEQAQNQRGYAIQNKRRYDTQNERGYDTGMISSADFDIEDPPF